MAITGALKKRHQTGQGLVAIVTLTASGSYSTGGDSLDLPALVGYTNRQPDFVDINGSGGYVYQYDLANKKVKVFSIAGFTPAGTVAAPVFTGTAVKPEFTVKNGTIGSNMTMGLTADAASASVVGGTGITTDRTLTTSSPVGTVTPTGVNSAPAFTGTAVAAAALSELAATTYPSGVTSDVITLMAWWIPTPSLTA